MAEGERRVPRAGTLSLEQVFEAFARGEGHMSGEPCSEPELARLEAAVGCPLPAPLRAFLARFGGGLFFHGHEIFGPTRVMIHDIELVPDMITVRRWLATQGQVLADGQLPFHRARGVVHVVDARTGAIVAIDGTHSFPDLAAFLETVVLPRKAH